MHIHYQYRTYCEVFYFEELIDDMFLNLKLKRVSPQTLGVNPMICARLFPSGK